MQSVGPALPTLITPHVNPFALADVRFIRKDEVLAIRRNLHSVWEVLRTPGAKVDPITVRHFAEHVVGLHLDLIEGYVVFTRKAAQELAPNEKKLGAQRALATARLKHQLELVYALLEPLVV